MIVGHRGAAALAPENTLAGIIKSADLGITWIEIDTQLSADGVPMIFHDETVGRCTDGIGEVAQLTLEELKRLDAGSWFDSDFSGERIPTLVEVLSLCKDRGISINLELKVHYDHQAEPLVNRIAQVIEDFGFPHDQLLLSSFSERAVELCKVKMPSIRRGYISESKSIQFLEGMDYLELYSVHLDHHVVTPESAKRILDKGLVLNIWTLNDPSKAEYFTKMGVNAIITDDPTKFIEKD